ncbi:MAG: hypothetical protein LBD08_01405, partial [Treponema sp.]|nr:hypothetical protein [Treponema sp.]
MFDLKDYGYIQASYPAEIPAGLIPGRVTEDRRGRYKVICERGEVPAVLKGRFYHRVEEREALPVVGDFALLDYNPLGDSGIAGLLPRRSKFSRTDFSGHGAAYVKNIQEQV